MNFNYGNTGFFSSPAPSSNSSKRITSTVTNNSNTNANFKTYLMALIIGYFVTQLIYPTFYKLTPPTTSHEKMIDLAVTLVLASIVYVVTNVPEISWVFFIGMLVGLNYPAFYYTQIEPDNHNTVGAQATRDLLTTIVYVGLVALIGFLLYLGTTSVGANYVLYFGVLVLMLIGIIWSKKGFYFWQEPDNPQMWHRSSGQVIKFGLSFTAWLVAMMFVFPEGGSEMLQLCFGFIMGIFVGNMSYKGTDYLVKDQLAVQGQKMMEAPGTGTSTGEQDRMKWIMLFVICFNLSLFILYFVK